MPRATESNILQKLEHCYIMIPQLLQQEKIYMNNLPEIGDSKSASYPDEIGMGRSTPFKSYAGSENRTITWKANFFLESTKGDDEIANGLTAEDILRYIRCFEACLYPFAENDSVPYAPPPVCRLKCGSLLSKEGEIHAIMKQYQVSYDTTVPWEKNTYLPYKVTVDLSFDVIYDQTELPGAELILELGY